MALGGGGERGSDGHSEGEEEEEEVMGSGDGAEEEGVESGDSGVGEEESECEVEEDSEDQELGGGTPSMPWSPLEVGHCWVVDEVTAEDVHPVGKRSTWWMDEIWGVMTGG